MERNWHTDSMQRSIPNRNKAGWILVGGGPDRDIDLTYKRFSPTVKKFGSKRSLGTLFSQYGYDPTNGTISDGDIMRFHQ